GLGSKDTLCLYSGNIAIKQELEILVKAAGQLPACRFVICGDGTNRKILQDKVKNLNLTNTLFINLQPLDRLPAMLSGADIHLILQKAGAADLVMPSKLTNIMAVGGVAVVATEYSSELGQLGEGEQACLYRCNPENTDALVEAIKTLRNNNKLFSELGTRAKKYADNHLSMKKILGEFERQCRSLIAFKKQRQEEE
ncbi:glycosyltransferase, partial [Desulfobulbus sp. TB]|nr:glycosyltransferase [Desulfobulbus sp. TB]